MWFILQKDVVIDGRVIRPIRYRSLAEITNGVRSPRASARRDFVRAILRLVAEIMK